MWPALTYCPLAGGGTTAVSGERGPIEDRYVATRGSLCCGRRFFSETCFAHNSAHRILLRKLRPPGESSRRDGLRSDNQTPPNQYKNHKKNTHNKHLWLYYGVEGSAFSSPSLGKGRASLVQRHRCVATRGSLCRDKRNFF